MIGRVLCLGTGNQHTSPKPEWADDRIYKYAPPGKMITYYQGEAGEREGQTFYPLEEREDECDSRYGIIVITDFIMRELKQQVVPLEDAPHNEFEDKLVVGDKRAASLVQRWAATRIAWNAPNYGAVLMKGKQPTDDEIRVGMEARKRYAIARLTEGKKNQMLRLQGARGHKAGWDLSDLAWAEEFGFSIDIPLDKVQRPPNAPEYSQSEGGDRVSCPFCAEMIMPAAKKCRYCTKTFERLTVIEYLAAQDVQTVA